VDRLETVVDKRRGETSMAAKKATGKARKSAAKKTTRKKAGAKKTAPKKAARKKTAPRKRSGAVSRIQQELPATLGEFSRGVRRQLNAMERNIEKTDWRYRRQTTRALRDASHLLGRLEADGERAWKRLTAQARREVLGVLRRVESAVEGPQPRSQQEARRSTARTAPRARRSPPESSGSGI
jgi:hypothetical protein